MRVLLVEDDEYISRSLETVLAKENYAVDVAVDGELGWQFIESFAYDLILLDVMLPKLDGISLCRQIRESRYQTPVLLLTGRNSSTDRIAGLDAGADDYMVKPFELPELLARMRVLLRRGSSPVVPLLEWNQLQVDPAACQATYSDQTLNLTPKEYRLLELFLRNPRQVFTRSAILEHLWNLEETPTEDTITAHVKGIRQKLKQVGAPANFIETVYGIGYRLKASPRKTSQPASQPAQQNTQIQAALQDIWQKYVPRNLAHLQILATAVAELEAGAAPAWQQVQMAAHKLVGALGLFGQPQGSELALRLENFFRAEQLPNPEELAVLVDQLDQLNALLHPVLPIVGSLPYANLALVILDDHASNTPNQSAQFIAELMARYPHVLPQITSLDQLISYTASHPDSSELQIAVIKLSLSQLSSRDLAKIASLTQQIPPIPVFVCADQLSLELRVRLAQAEVRAVLPRLAPDQLLAFLKPLRPTAAPAHVLMVDDDSLMLDSLQALLETWGLQFTRVEQPQQFWQTLQQAAPDLLILDVEMPAYSGIDLCRTLRNSLNWQHLPVLFLTAHTDAATLQNALNAGADALIAKSAPQSEILHQVLSELQREQLKPIGLIPA